MSARGCTFLCSICLAVQSHAPPGPLMCTMWAALAVSAVQSCNSDLNCSLNGLCTQGVCACDPPWAGDRCQRMVFAPGRVGLGGIPLCSYHGDDVNSTSWGASVLHAPDDGLYYAWVASMVK